jgi:hypothetical protein
MRCGEAPALKRRNRERQGSCKLTERIDSLRIYLVRVPWPQESLQAIGRNAISRRLLSQLEGRASPPQWIGDL